MISSRRPPTFIPGMPCCQPGITPVSGSGDRLAGAVVPGGVELLAALVEDADVLDGDGRAGLGGRAGALDQILDRRASSAAGPVGITTFGLLAAAAGSGVVLVLVGAGRGRRRRASLVTAAAVGAADGRELRRPGAVELPQPATADAAQPRAGRSDRVHWHARWRVAALETCSARTRDQPAIRSSTDGVDVEVRVHRADVVGLLERVDQLHQLRGVGLVDRHAGLRAAGSRRRSRSRRRPASSASRHRDEIAGLGDDLVDVVVERDVLGAGVDRGASDRPRRSARRRPRSRPACRTGTTTDPGSPRLPPCLESAWRTSAPVRLRLSVSASISSATPPGP